MMHDHGEVRLRHSSCEADEQSRATGCGAGGAKGGDQGECGASKARAGHRAGEPCHRRWSAYGKQQGKGRRRGSPRSSTTSASTCSTRHSSNSRKDAAPGVDGLTWPDYEQNLERNLEDLHARVHRGAYRALPSRRTFIPKPDGRQRPLAIAALEDKIVQRATVAVLNAIYEEDFLGFSYGFRPGRGTHDALDALVVGIESTKVNWILDADIRSFFEEISQEWLVRFLEHRIGDRRIIRLIQKWLKAGILEDGIVTVSERGTGQGAGSHRFWPMSTCITSSTSGRALATARGYGRHDHRAVCRRLYRRLSARGRRPSLPR